NRNLRATWRRIALDAPAMCAAVFLAVFALLALADSIHYRPRLPDAPEAAHDAAAAYATRTLSALDSLLWHAIASREQTYSAPLAYWSFQRETAIVDGNEVRAFPRLFFGGAQLTDPATQWKADLAARSAR